MSFNIGDKVIPIKKSSRKRELENCASYYNRVELNQEFLFVNGIDEVATKEI